MRGGSREASESTRKSQKRRTRFLVKQTAFPKELIEIKAPGAEVYELRNTRLVREIGSAFTNSNKHYYDAMSRTPLSRLITSQQVYIVYCIWKITKKLNLEHLKEAFLVHAHEFGH